MNLNGYIQIPTSQLEQARTTINNWLSQLSWLPYQHPSDTTLALLIRSALNRDAANPDDTHVSYERTDSCATIKFVCSSDPNLQNVLELLECLGQIAGAEATADTYHGHRYVLQGSQVTDLQGTTLYFSDPTRYSVHDLMCLAQLGDPQVLEMVATNPNCSPDNLNQLANHPEIMIVRRVAANRSTPPDTLSGMADPGRYDETVRRRVAGNLNTSPQDLLELLQDPDSDVAQLAAQNPNTPKYALAMFQLAGAQIAQTGL
jgi:hypothetical protein